MLGNRRQEVHIKHVIVVRARRLASQPSGCEAAAYSPPKQLLDLKKMGYALEKIGAKQLVDQNLAHADQASREELATVVAQELLIGDLLGIVCTKRHFGLGCSILTQVIEPKLALMLTRMLDSADVLHSFQITMIDKTAGFHIQEAGIQNRCALHTILDEKLAQFVSVNNLKPLAAATIKEELHTETDQIEAAWRYRRLTMMTGEQITANLT